MLVWSPTIGPPVSPSLHPFAPSRAVQLCVAIFIRKTHLEDKNSLINVDFVEVFAIFLTILFIGRFFLLLSHQHLFIQVIFPKLDTGLTDGTLERTSRAVYPLACYVTK